MYVPAVPLSGVAGWRFIQATETQQRTAFESDATVRREVTYFAERIAEVGSAQELVADRTLLKVALGAFGLDEEIFKKAFLERILSEGTDDPEALANRFVDPRYTEFSRAFGFGDVAGPRVAAPGFAAEITTAYQTRQFERAVGEVNDDMRLALNFRREIATYAGQGEVDPAQWFRILGDSPLRAVVEAAFNLPTAFAGLDIDKQRETLQDKARELFGSESVAVFQDPANVQRVIDRFLVRSQIESGPGPGTPGAAALSLLQSSQASSGLTNLILSAR
ncbi:MAG: DUF1217 domain-containing protein [Pseudomonadota bacterium]